MKRLTQTLPVFLAAALQLMPLVRNLFINPATGNTFAFILRWGIGTGAALGAVDAVSGATNSFAGPFTFNTTTNTPFTNNLLLSAKTSGDGGSRILTYQASSIGGLDNTFLLQILKSFFAEDSQEPDQHQARLDVNQQLKIIFPTK